MGGPSETHSASAEPDDGGHDGYDGYDGYGGSPAARQVDTLIGLGGARFHLFRDEQRRTYAHEAEDVFAIPSPECIARLKTAFPKVVGRYATSRIVRRQWMPSLHRPSMRGAAEPGCLCVGGERSRIVLDTRRWCGSRRGDRNGSWFVRPFSPVNFPRRTTTQAIPARSPGGRLRFLRPFVNVGTDEDFMLVCAWLVRRSTPVGVLLETGRARCAWQPSRRTAP
jgi:hypothetical protein